jgi:chemotaxis protein MotB
METAQVVRTRRFPWRLWLYAIAMTGGTGAGGYFAWQYRQADLAAESKLTDCQSGAGKLDVANKAANDCKTALDGASKKVGQLEALVAETDKGRNATKDELDALRAQKADADKRVAAIADIQKQFAKMVDTGQLRVTARHGELVLSLPSEVLFPSGSAELSKQGEYAVVEVGAVLKTLPDRRFLIIGHTDNQDLKVAKDQPCAFKDNLQLSTERALTVTRVLVTAGMDGKNLLPSGAGEKDPIAPNTTAEGRQKNRRIEIALLPAIQELPPLPESLKEEPPPGPQPPQPAPGAKP